MRTGSARFFWGMGCTLLLAALYPISILINFGLDGSRWVQNDLAYGLFVLFVLPLAVGVFAQVFQLDTLRRIPNPTRAALLTLLVILVVFAGTLASREVFRSPGAIPAFLLKHPTSALKLDCCLRRSVNPMVCPAVECSDVVSNLPDEPSGTWALDIYREHAPAYPFADYGDLFARANTTVYVSWFFDVASGVFVMIIFWYLIAVVVAKRGRERGISDGLVMVYALMLLWFPTRLYSEWYLNFYNVAHLREYFAFWTLFVVALLAIPLLVYLFKPGRPVLIFSTVNGVFLAMFGAINQFTPGILRAIASGLETMPFPYFLAIVLLVFIMLATMVFVIATQEQRGSATKEKAS